MISLRNYQGRKGREGSRSKIKSGAKKVTKVTIVFAILLTAGLIWGGIKLTKFVISKRKAAKAATLSQAGNLQAV